MVEYFIGKRSYHSYALETTYGDAASPLSGDYSWMGVVQSISPSSKSDIIQINGMDDVGSRNVTDYIETLRHYSGSIEFLVQHCRPLMMAIGSDAVTGTYEHTLTEEDELPSFTLNFGYQHGTTDHAIDYLGCVVNRLNIECTKGEFLKATMEFIAQSGEDHAFRSYQSADGLKKYPSVGAGSIRPYNYSDSSVTINGITYCPETVKMSISNNLLAEPCLNSDHGQRIAEPIPQLREYESSMTIKMATDDLYDIWETGVYIGTDPVITFARSPTDKVVFTLEDAILESAISPFNISEGLVLVELPLKVKKIGVVETNNISTDYDNVEV